MNGVKHEIESINDDSWIFNRDYSLDLIRCIAVLCVVSVHFLYNSGFYGEKINTSSMFILVFMRTIFMVCVPLFLLLTGYLMNQEVLRARYYKKIIYILEIYVLNSVCCLLFRTLYLKESLSFKQSILEILGFSANSYSWYVEMYLGLFLLIPFLNIAYHGLDSQKKKLVLICTFLFLTSLPSLFNIFELSGSDLNFLANNDKKFSQIIPAWWTAIYPVTYYFIGAFISEYKPKVNKLILSCSLLMTITLFSVFNIGRNFTTTFQWDNYVGLGGFENTVDSVLLFILVMNLNINNAPGSIKAVLAKIADLSFATYLFSNISDHFLYPKLIKYVPAFSDRIAYYLLIVLLSFTASCIMSQLLIWLIKCINHICGQIKLRS